MTECLRRRRSQGWPHRESATGSATAASLTGFLSLDIEVYAPLPITRAKRPLLTPTGTCASREAATIPLTRSAHHAATRALPNRRGRSVPMVASTGDTATRELKRDRRPAEVGDPAAQRRASPKARHRQSKRRTTPSTLCVSVRAVKKARSRLHPGWCAAGTAAQAAVYLPRRDTGADLRARAPIAHGKHLGHRRERRRAISTRSLCDPRR